MNCSYNLWIVNKTNYQSERRLQSPQTRYNIYIYIYMFMCAYTHKYVSVCSLYVYLHTDNKIRNVDYAIA
jgi:hypothetical protein